jgi:hypothetical protein
MRWGANDDEVRAAMAGDELVPVASFIATRAITIRARPENVWPWIVQMGYRRAGFYTYDIADNAGYPSADQVLEQYQHFRVGDWAFNMNSVFGIELPINEFDAFTVQAFEANNWLLWVKPGSTWSWLLKPLPDGQTRLILRIRARPANLFWTLFMEFGDPPMARRMLKGIKARAEGIGTGPVGATQQEVKGTKHALPGHEREAHFLQTIRLAFDALTALPLWAIAPLVRGWHLRWGQPQVKWMMTCPATKSCQERNSMPLERSRSMRRPSESGHGSCNWATAGRGSTRMT